MQGSIFGSELGKLRAESLRTEAGRGAGPASARWRVVLGRRFVAAGAWMMGACRPAVLAELEGRRR
jgi:hypothetical protein